MGLTESETRAKLIDPAIHSRGWTEEHIRREETAGAVEIIDGKPRKKAKGRVDYVLRLKGSADSQPVAIAIIEAKAEHLAPNHGLEQAKAYSACNRMNVQFVFSSNGHLFVEYDRFTGKTTQPKPMPDFPSPGELQTRYEQGMGFELNDAAAVTANRPKKNARILVATYQALGIEGEDGDASFLIRNYPENYFSHIVIDECHRSAWGKWSIVLTRNSAAVQIGLTATPRKIENPETPEAKNDRQITSDNLTYFGEPVYEYDMSQGIEDGYLAACEIQKGRVNLDQAGLTKDQILARNPRNAITGAPITREEANELYEKTTFEKQLLLPDRVMAMCEDFFQFLVDSGAPEQKTIIFCARDSHADDVAAKMNNLYVDWCQKQNRQPLTSFAFKCTAAGGKDNLPELRGASRSHFIATTVER